MGHGDTRETILYALVARPICSPAQLDSVDINALKEGQTLPMSQPLCSKSQLPKSQFCHFFSKYVKDFPKGGLICRRP